MKLSINVWIRKANSHRLLYLVCRAHALKCGSKQSYDSLTISHLTTLYLCMLTLSTKLNKVTLSHLH